ncbi:hypothetical protein D3C80_106290 [compost metagenome]
MIMAYTKDEYYAVKDMNQVLTGKLVKHMLVNGELKQENVKLLEEIEVLRAERSHWYHMYNNNVDERPDI